MRPVLNRPLLQEEAAAVITTAGDEARRPRARCSFSNTNTNGLTLGLSSFHGTTDMITNSAPR